MADTDDMIDIAESEFEEFVGKDTSCICEPK